MGWLFLAIAVVIAADFLMRLCYVRLILPQFEAVPVFNIQPHPRRDDVERVVTTSSDGVLLRGSLFRAAEQPARGLIVFLPELDGTHWSAPYYAEGLLHAGFDVLSVDFRGQGDSEAAPGYRPIHWPTHGELRDAQAVLKFISSRDDLRHLPLGLFGVSRGSLVALITAARNPQVLAVCGEGTYTIDTLVEHFVLRWAQLYLPQWVLRLLPRWHISFTLRLVRWTSEIRRGVRYAIVERWLPGLRYRPVLLISGERDNYVQPEIVRSIRERIASPLAEIWLVPRAKHNQARECVPDEYDRRVVEFFSRMVPQEAEESAPIIAAAR